MIDLDDIPLDQQTSAQHRARYDALRALAQSRATSDHTPPRSAPPIEDHAMVLRELIPGGWYWTTPIARGQTLRVRSPQAGASVSLLLWNAHLPSERYNAPDTMKLQWTVRMDTGMLLLSDMGRVLAAVTADSAGRHDMLLGGSTPATNQARYGDATLRNTRDNFRLAAAKLGLDQRDIPPCITLFADLRADEAGRFVFHGASQAGAFVDLRAEMDLLVALSNCPHPLDPNPAYAPPAIEAVIWNAGPVSPDDVCRTGGPEAQRAYENTARLIDV